MNDMPPQEDLVASAAVDLIRKLDTSFSNVQSSIVTGARDAEEARRNARVASELARRFANPTIAEEPGVLTATTTNHTPTTDNTARRKPPPPPPTTTTTTMNGTSTPNPHHQRQAEELLNTTLELERTKDRLETQMMHYHEMNSELEIAQSKIKQLEDQLRESQESLETIQYQSSTKLEQLESQIEAVTQQAQLDRADADYATQLAEQKIQSEQEMRIMLQQVLDRNEEYRVYLETKHVRFSEPLEAPPSASYSRTLVSAGRELLQKYRNQHSPKTATTNHSSSANVTSLVQSTARILQQSAVRLHFSGDEWSSQHEVPNVDRLAQKYTALVEWQLQQKQNELQELESLVSLLEDGMKSS